MARIYNPTMLMLDPSNVMNAVRLGREREAQEREARKGIATGIGELGGALAGIGGRALRQSEIGELPEDADEEWKAVVERFVDTGDISGINAYKQRKAEEEYKKKMAEIQKMEAEASKEASKNTAKELSLKEKKSLEMEKADYTYGLNKAIRKAQESHETKDYKDASEDYEYYKKKLMLLDVPTEDIKSLPPMPEFEKTPTGTGEGDKSGAFSRNTYSARKRNAEDRINAGWKTEEERKALEAELDELSNTEFGSEDQDIVKLKDKVRKGKSKEVLDREALRKKVADAILFEGMPLRKRAALDDKEFERLAKNYEEMIKRPDWEQLKSMK